jgi:hypothetical protein
MLLNINDRDHHVNEKMRHKYEMQMIYRGLIKNVRMSRSGTEPHFVKIHLVGTTQTTAPYNNLSIG